MLNVGKLKNTEGIWVLPHQLVDYEINESETAAGGKYHGTYQRLKR